MLILSALFQKSCQCLRDDRLHVDAQKVLSAFAICLVWSLMLKVSMANQLSLLPSDGILYGGISINLQRHKWWHYCNILCVSISTARTVYIHFCRFCLEFNMTAKYRWFENILLETRRAYSYILQTYKIHLLVIWAKQIWTWEEWEVISLFIPLQVLYVCGETKLFKNISVEVSSTYG